MLFMSHTSEKKYFSAYSLAKNVISAVSLIGLGFFLLLNSTGMIPWEAWKTVFFIFLRIWPIYVIFAGVNIMSGGSKTVNIITDFLGCIIFLGILVLAGYYAINNIEIDVDFIKNIYFLKDINFN